MYPSGLDDTAAHDLLQEVPPGDVQSQKIYNGIVSIEHGGEGHAPDNKHAIAWVMLRLFGVAVHWSAKTQPASITHYTDS